MSSLNRFYVPGDWRSAKQQAMIAGIGAVLAYVADNIYNNGTAMAAIAVVLYFGAGLLFSANLFGQVRRHGIGANSDSTPLWVLSATLLTMWFLSWELVGLAALAVSFMGNATALDRRFQDWGWWYIGTLALVVIAQFWLNTAILNTMGSDEDLIGNDRIQGFAPLISAIGFGVFVIRMVPVRGTIVVGLLLCSVAGFYHLQTFAVDLWAKAQSKEDQRFATTVYFGKIAALSQYPWELVGRAPDPSPELIRLAASFWPAKAVMSGDAGVLEAALDSAEAEHVLRAMRIEMIRPGQAKEQGMKRLKRLRKGYEDYLHSYLLRLDNEATARNIAKKYYPALLKNQHEPLTRRALADHVIEQVKAELPESRRSAQGLQRTFSSQRNSNKLARMLQEEGIHLDDGWRFSTVSGFRGDLMQTFMRTSDTANRQVEARLGASPLRTGSLQVEGKRFMTWPDYTRKAIGVVLPVGDIPTEWYGFTEYIDDLNYMFANNSTEDLMQLLGSAARASTDSTLPMKAAIVPAVVIIASFLVMVLNFGALVGALFDRYRRTIIEYTPKPVLSFFDGLTHIRKILAVGFVLGLMISGGGPVGTYLTWQAHAYSAGNAVFGGVASLSDYPTGHSHHEELAVHHLKQAQRLIRGNSNLERSFAYANYHIEMAVYYDIRAKKKGKELARQILSIYENRGATELGHEKYREYRDTQSFLRSTVGV